MATTITTPSIEINTIIRMTEFDLLRTKQVVGNMYMCLDTMKLYFDQGVNPQDRVTLNYISVRTANDLQYNITPIYGSVYYCWEDNSLWIWQNKWIALYSATTYPSGYVYDDVPSVSSPQELSAVYRYDMPSAPADDNGLLKDGSVIVRDRNRLIKGKLYIDEGNDNLVISSYLGGGIRLLPNGRMTTDGEFYIDTEIVGTSNVAVSGLRAKFSVLNNEMYVDYSENASLDHNTFQNNTHIYKVFHEGNLDTSAIIVMTPLQVYQKLTVDKSTLPSVYDFNVAQLEGHPASDFALVQHTHKYQDITDMADHIGAECESQIRRVFNSMSSTGITSSYNIATGHLTLSANDFNLTFTGGATGTGRVEGLTNTSIELTIDPTKHIHQDLINEITSLQARVTALEHIINNN